MRELREVWPGTGASVIYLPVEGQVPGGFLSARENAVYSAFQLEKRRREWLAGRLAAKTLLSAGGLAPSACEIGMDKFGRPCCGQSLVSISHSNGWAMAAIKPGSTFLGADLERIEERHPAWYSDYFHPAELASRDPSEATRIWTMKEALLKALGLGLMADPLDIRTGERIMLSGKALERHREMGGPHYSVETRSYPEGFWAAVAA
ncbi:MAG: 4'-phosphopantetheinyl transferase superfamily protein [Elusimicrobia bacterium]|nr:4'-phosphopantetheinyl transferase superfamily protein [Elusimicrobiota bacterium]